MITILVVVLTMAAAYWKLSKKLNEMDAFNRETRKWIFDSLYSINHNVKLPNEDTKVEMKKAIIYNESKDPYSEFNGKLDDWHK